MSSQPSSSSSRRRDKPVLSCTFCRGRKLRCDRQSPCGACVRRGRTAECVFTASEQERKDAVDYRPHTRSKPEGTRQRIARLESLVTAMRDREEGKLQPSLNNASPTHTSNSPEQCLGSTIGSVTDNVGRLSLSENDAVYVGSSHWTTILDDIRQLKDEMPDDFHSDTRTPESNLCDLVSVHEPPAPRLSLLTGAGSLSKEQILAMVPARKVVDRHVLRFFNAFDLAPLVLNRNKFLSEYESFWVNYSAAPVMWLGLLFSVMGMSAFQQQQQQDATSLGPSAVETIDDLESYRRMTINCLIAGDYLRSGRYTIETLVLHFALEQQMNKDTDVGNWVLIGVIIRIALRNGLHRDPSHWSNIRPLQAELRRRIWLALYQMDFFTSTQVGLPRIIKDSQCDTRLPCNLLDNDLSVGSSNIPLGRPLTDDTPLSHVIQRHDILKVTAEIYDATESGLLTAESIAKLDAKLQKAVEDIPVRLKYEPVDSLVADSPVTILQRTFIDILMNKAIYLLHRQSFIKGTNRQQSTKSNQICIDAALTILGHQQRVNEETQPGGLLFPIRWKVVSSLTHEFLQATMMLCLALSRYNDQDIGVRRSCQLHRQAEILQTLSAVRAIWEDKANTSSEAQRANETITAVLNRSNIDDTADNVDFTGLSAQSSGFESQIYLGSFNFGEYMGLDPSAFMMNDGTNEFGGMLDGFEYQYGD